MLVKCVSNFNDFSDLTHLLPQISANGSVRSEYLSRSTRYVCIERVSFGVQDMLTDVAVGYDTILDTTNCNVKQYS